MKQVFRAVMLAIIVLLPGILLAQDTPVEAPACDLPNLQNDINYFIGELGKLKTETDTAKIANQLQVLANGANSLRASCDNLAFTDTKSKVIVPVKFPEGIYRAIAETNTMGISVNVTATEGECGAGTSYLSENVFLVTKGEAVFTSKGCSALIEVKSFGDEVWNLRFERLTN